MAKLRDVVGATAVLALLYVFVAADRPKPRTPDRVALTPTSAPESNEISVEPDVPDTPLEAYKKAAEPIDRKIALAGVALQCGLRAVDWYNSTVRMLEDYRNGSAFYGITDRLTANERSQAYAFDRQIVADETRFVLGSDRLSASACREFNAAPYSRTDRAFLP
jgi:hypothetical protein